MIERLAIVKQRFDEVSDLIIQPEVISDQKRYIALNREYKDLCALMEKRKEYLDLINRQQEEYFFPKWVSEWFLYRSRFFSLWKMTWFESIKGSNLK